eukprot:TRINITY_DN42233_c0_g2_i1.p1 TRINITY_DN42233_c0_g2~~TRINITY_DN42233_c0_g2_i1.p1  ORF type:complete len:344 (-),score=57.50 TRINITY_DN42233_c0_g2_i1:15-1046(-)
MSAASALPILVTLLSTCVSADAPVEVSPVVACADEPECSSWVSDEDFSNCSLFPLVLEIYCPKACGRCDAPAQALARSCSEVAGGQVRLVSSPGDLSLLASNMVHRLHEERGEAMHVLSSAAPGPLAMQVDDFLSREETAALIAAAEQSGLLDSSRYIDGAAELRTSKTGWCKGSCALSPIVVNVTERVAALLKVPASNFEPMQFVKYGPGELYTRHSDMVPEDVEKPCGPRLLTFFMYLSDGFKGGETAFPELGFKVTPKRGRAAAWTNSRVWVGGKTGKMRWLPDSKANHESIAIESPPPGGDVVYKYAVNLWLHNSDLRIWERYHEECAQVPAGPNPSEL